MRIQPYLNAILILYATGFSCTVTEKQEEEQPKEKQRPNIILIMADDMGYETVGCNGGIEYATPNLDNMAARGVRFSQCYSQPLCTPSRVKIMTGKYNFRNYEHFGYLRTDQKTFGNYLKDVGYKTCIVGKWQLNGHGKPVENSTDLNRPNHFGFDEYCLWQMNHPNSKGNGRYANPLITQNGEELPRNKELYGPDIFSDYLCEFIKRNADSTFFAYYPMVLPHSPFVPTPDSPDWANEKTRYKRDTIFFNDMIRYIDKLVLKIENSLKENNVFDNTILIFTADNGTHGHVLTNTINGVVRGGKGFHKNTGNHVPFIFSWGNKLPKNKNYDDLIDFADILPTLLDAAGIDLADIDTDGTSFLASITGDNQSIQDEVFIHYTPRHNHKHNRWVLDGNYKLFQDGRFYNTKTDPDEKTELEELTEEEKLLKNRFQKLLDDKENEAPFHLNDTLFLMNNIID